MEERERRQACMGTNLPYVLFVIRLGFVIPAMDWGITYSTNN